VKTELAKSLQEGKRNTLRKALDAKLHQNARIEEL